jgi:DNA-binding Lrp family transcriptional regulator
MNRLPPFTARDGSADPLRVAVDMSELDLEIIRRLQSDGRAPFAQIAREVGVTERTVRRRVNQLLTNGIVQITTVTDYELLGYGAAALVGIRLDGGRSAKELAAVLAQVNTIDYVVVTSGRYNLFAEIVCRDSSELLATVETEIWQTRGVSGTEVLPYLRLHYQEPRWEVARWKAARGGLGKRPLNLDEIDRKILVELNADGRIPVRGLARKLAISEWQVRERIDRILNSGAVRVLAITNPRSLGFKTMAWIGIVAARGSDLEKLADRLAALDAIAYVAICAGRFDLVVEASCVDNEDLFRVLNEEVRPLPEVDRAESFLYLDLYYKRLRPRYPST